MSYSKFKIVLCLIVLTAALAWASNASAVCVVSYPGPTTFNGIDDAVVLPSVSIGLEGTVSLEFKANDTAGMHGLWYCSDKPAPVPGSLGEYRILLTNNTVWGEVWPAGCSSGFGVDFPLTDTTHWHTVSMSWRNGVDTVLTFDSVQERFPIAYEDGTPCSLNAFTSGPGYHYLGHDFDYSNNPFRFFDGQMRNVAVYNTYEVPEPSVLASTVTGLFGWLAYARRKRR